LVDTEFDRFVSHIQPEITHFVSTSHSDPTSTTGDNILDFLKIKYIYCQIFLCRNRCTRSSVTTKTIALLNLISDVSVSGESIRRSVLELRYTVPSNFHSARLEQPNRIRCWPQGKKTTPYRTCILLNLQGSHYEYIMRSEVRTVHTIYVTK
jgi:hypothetical protein